MTQSAPQKDLQIPTVIAIIALLGISFSVGLTAMLMTAVLFLEVGGLEGGLMFMLLGSPVVGFLMGMGSLVVMGGHAAWWETAVFSQIPCRLDTQLVG